MHSIATRLMVFSMCTLVAGELRMTLPLHNWRASAPAGNTDSHKDLRINRPPWHVFFGWRVGRGTELLYRPAERKQRVAALGRLLILMQNGAVVKFGCALTKGLFANISHAPWQVPWRPAIAAPPVPLVVPTEAVVEQ